MTARATFHLVDTSDVWVGALEGDVDVSNASALGEQIIDAVSNEPLGLVLDLSKVGYLDSSGVSLLFGLVRALGARRQSLVIALQDSSPLHRLLAVTKLDAVIPIRASLDEAIEAARATESDPRLA